MPPIEQLGMHQKAVLWAFDGTMNSYGQPNLGSAAEITVQWTAVRREVEDPQGNTVVISAEVKYTSRIATGSQLWLGALADLPGTGYTANAEYMEVVGVEYTPDIRGQVFEYVHLCTLKSNTRT